jgi:hypothetical protein
MPAARVQNWRELAEAASKETDSTKLLEMVAQLCDALDEVHTNGQPTDPEPSKAETLHNERAA